LGGKSKELKVAKWEGGGKKTKAARMCQGGWARSEKGKLWETAVQIVGDRRTDGKGKT